VSAKTSRTSPSAAPDLNVRASDTTGVSDRARTFALVGNPNTGKTTLFNALTGFRRHVANYPGVTVEIATGRVRVSDPDIRLVDLPGTYSLAAISPDEGIVTSLLSGSVNGFERPDAILAIVDATNLARNLYLVTQLLELELPLVIALNMSDVAARRGIGIDAAQLGERLGVPVIPIVATDDGTLPPLIRVLGAAVDRPRPVLPKLSSTDADGHPGSPPAAANQRMNPEEVRARYAWINGILDGVVTRPDRPIVTWSDRLDSILTGRLSGAIILLAVLFVVFQAIFSWAGPLMDAIGALFDRLGAVVGAWLPDGAVQSFLVDGVIAGVGGVLTFLPQILILFLFIAALEDCGYLARAAFMMDRLMRVVGLSGRSLIPLLSAYACAIPAIMSTRTIADRRERCVTILIAPFMSCSARVPVYVLLIAAFVPMKTWLGGWVGLQGLVMLGMYAVGVFVAIPVAWLLKCTAFAGPKPGFLLELPSYKLPRLRTMWQRMYFAGRSFLMRAGTVILAVNLVVWALSYFPRSEQTRREVAQQRIAAGWDDSRFESELAGAYLRSSYLGRMGRGIEPLIAPLGWDWRIGVSVLASFPAREVIVASLGTIFNLSAADAEAGAPLQEALRAATRADGVTPLFTLPVALSIMVFFALCAQCASTLVMIGREMRSFAWPVASFVGMTTIAYLAAWAVAAAARSLGW
jgi:ferrous iron transport protein B